MNMKRSDFCMLTSQKRWKYRPIDSEKSALLHKELGVSALVAKLLVARGWDDPEQAKLFLHVNREQFCNPFLMDGMQEAIERIQQAIEGNENIRVYGDYDCDGVTSTTLMVLALREVGANVDYYIPNRFSEGYGLNVAALDLAVQDGIQLVITVDTGISGYEEVAHATQIGLDMIVTDHHEPPANLPQCTAVLNPIKPGCPYPFKHLSGAGVCLKVAHALLGEVPEHLLDIACMGTIADLVPLIGENRLIAYYGLKRMNQTSHIGLQQLIALAELEDTYIQEHHIGFALGPRINASGRLDTADTAVQLLLSADAAQGKELATKLNQLNMHRQTLVNETTEEAIDWVEQRYGLNKPKVLVLAKEGWHEGVLGIVASRLVERYYVPTIVLSIDAPAQKAKGSARSIEGFDMFQALCQCAHLLPRFGGHTMAAGMSLEVEHIDQLRSKLAEIAEQWLSEEDLKPVAWVDVNVEPVEMTIETIEELHMLAPFGMGNPKPVISLTNLTLKGLKQVGAQGQHLKCQLEADGHVLDGIGFGLGDKMSQISSGAKVDVLGDANINEWNGNQKAQVMIKDIRVQDRQFFDWRGTKDRDRKWDKLYYEQSPGLCIFRQADIPDQAKSVTDQFIYFDDQGNPHEGSPQGNLCDTFILYDVPKSKGQLREACRHMLSAKRFYLCFQQNEGHFFSTIPEREHFRWYYAWLKQREQKGQFFQVDKDVHLLAKHKGWTQDAIHFMNDVFLELKFIEINNGVVRLISQPPKKDLIESKCYRQKQEELEIEEALVYATYQDVFDLLETYINVENKEAIVHGF